MLNAKFRTLVSLVENLETMNFELCFYVVILFGLARFFVGFSMTHQPLPRNMFLQAVFSEPVVFTACEFLQQSASSVAQAVKLAGYAQWKFIMKSAFVSFVQIHWNLKAIVQLLNIESFIFCSKM